MFLFALKDMKIKRVKIFFVCLSVIITAAVALLAFNIANQVEDGIVDGAAYYDIIIGPSGSSTQLTMNTLFFTDTPLGTIPYSYVTELEESGMCNDVIPFCMGDSYNGAKIVGTTPSYLSAKTIAQGEMFEEDELYTCVVGADVAAQYNLKVGDKIVTSHGLTSIGTEHASSPLTVVGILESSHSVFDGAVFTSYKTVWAVHEHEEEEEDHEEEEEGHAEAGTVCAIIVRSKSFNDYNKIQSYYGQNTSLLVVNPSTVLREVLESVDLSKKIVYVLCAVILIMNIFVISVITVMNMVDSKDDIKLMRLIGISSKKIRRLYLLENTVSGVLSAFFALGFSKLFLFLIKDITASMGIVMNAGKIYPLEFAIMAVVVVLSVLPTFICTTVMSSKDSL